MNDKIGWTKEKFEQRRKELKRRYNIIDEKEFEYRGYCGRAVLIRDNDNNTEEWCGKEALTWHRFYGYTLDEAKKDFHFLIDGMIKAGMVENRDD